MLDMQKDDTVVDKISDIKVELLQINQVLSEYSEFHSYLKYMDTTKYY